MIKLTQSENIHDFRPVLEGLTDDFGYDHYHAIMAWCGIIDPEMRGPDAAFWRVWLIKDQETDATIGLCGLYALDDSTEELWLGWFGILNEYRNKHLGEQALILMEGVAESQGCKTMWVHVSKKGKPLTFYFRNGFQYVCRVKTFIKWYPDYKEHFDKPMDYILKKQLA